MTQRKIIAIDGGSPEHWRQRKEGFRLIRVAERAAERLEGAPAYIAGAWDEEYGDYEPIENLGPFDAMADALQALPANETAVSILVAQRRGHIGRQEIRVVVDALSRDTDWVPGRGAACAASRLVPSSWLLQASSLRAALRGEARRLSPQTPLSLRCGLKPARPFGPVEGRCRDFLKQSGGEDRPALRPHAPGTRCG